MDRIKAAFVGCGGICNFHLSHLVQFDDVDYVGFMDIRPERAREKAAQVGGAPVFDNYCQMLDEAKPDVLYICVPPDQHGTIEFEAIKRKIHFLVEKPMALSMELATKIRDAAAEAGIITAVGFQDRYLDVIEKTREFLKGRQVGLVDGAWLGGIPGVYWWPTYATSGGQIVEQNIHLFDQLRFLFGEPETVFCAAGKGIVDESYNMPGYNVDDYSSATIKFKNGVVANLFTSDYHVGGSHRARGMTVYCKEATRHY